MTPDPVPDEEREVEVGVALQDEEHVEPERWANQAALANGVQLFEQRIPRYLGVKPMGYRSDWFARCPVCGWKDHQPGLPTIRQHAKEHPCLIG